MRKGVLWGSTEARPEPDSLSYQGEDGTKGKTERAYR